MKPSLMSFAILGRFAVSFGAPLPLLDVRSSLLVDERHLDLNSSRRASLFSDMCFSEFPIDFLPHTLSLASWKGQHGRQCTTRHGIQLNSVVMHSIED